MFVTYWEQPRLNPPTYSSLDEPASLSFPIGCLRAGQGHLGTIASLLCADARERSTRGTFLYLTSRCWQLSHSMHLWSKELPETRAKFRAWNFLKGYREKPGGPDHTLHKLYVSGGCHWCEEPSTCQNCASFTQKHLSVATWLHIFTKNVKHPPSTHFKNTKAPLHQVAKAAWWGWQEGSFAGGPTYCSSWPRELNTQYFAPQ